MTRRTGAIGTSRGSEFVRVASSALSKIRTGTKITNLLFDSTLSSRKIIVYNNYMAKLASNFTSYSLRR